MIDKTNPELAINLLAMINLKNIQTEVDASYLYHLLAENEKDENVAKVAKEINSNMTKLSQLIFALDKMVELQRKNR